MPRRRKRAEHWIYLQDDAPSIGAGWRGINVLSIGPKWVKIEAHASKTRAKFRRADWDVILRRSQQRLATAQH